ncbi:MAG TPA: hypothetical protein VFJ61_05605 [Solirubrobacterales bacterium]|nr:hypothetical protein [Solirubrobacterales bacterium]
MSRVFAWCVRAWEERAEDGRVRYAMAALGFGLIAGTFLPLILNKALVAFVLIPAGICLFFVAFIPECWSGEIWGWRCRRREEDDAGKG